MLIKFIRKRKVIWDCLSNSSINRLNIFSDYEQLMVLNLPYIPEIGSYVFIGGRKCEIKNVFINADAINGTKLEYKHPEYAQIIEQTSDFVNIAIEVDSLHMYIDYYDYMKIFTHSEDGKKSKDNVTKISDDERNKYEVVFPKTYEEWEKDADIMTVYDTLSDSEKIKLSYSRCRQIAN